ncbi:glycosyltransferase [Patescibacteria group bacterium]|nr:glycosyltransferase [Patescibacteria group bacterium]
MLHGKANKDQYVFLMRAYNEAESVGDVIDAIIHKGFSKIVIVNDGSSDATKAVLEKKKATYHDKHIVVLSHVINR